MAWTFLLVAGLLEILGDRPEILSRIYPAVADGWNRPGNGREFRVPRSSLEDRSRGTGYAVWTGIGAAGTAVLSMVLFAESASTIKVISLMCIVLGIIELTGSS